MTEPKTILITGSSSGIGKATAKLFQQQGWSVIATMRNPDDGAELLTLANVLVTKLDVTDPTSITTAIAAGLERFGKIDVLVNNAGFGAYGPLEATPVEKIKRQFDTNVLGLLETTKGILPHFRANHAGVIINISSIGGKVTFPLGTLYHGTKFAVEGISEALSYEMAAIGVKVKVVEPGAVKTDFGGRSFNFNNDESLHEYQELISKTMAAFAPIFDSAEDPIEVATVIYQAATDGTDQLRYISGKNAHALLVKRKAEDDATFISDLRKQFQLV